MGVKHSYQVGEPECGKDRSWKLVKSRINSSFFAIKLLRNKQISENGWIMHFFNSNANRLLCKYNNVQKKTQQNRWVVMKLKIRSNIFNITFKV